MDFRNWEGKKIHIRALAKFYEAIVTAKSAVFRKRIMSLEEDTSHLRLLSPFSHHFHLFCQSFSMAVYLVRQQSSAVLLQRLRAKGIRNPDHSRALSKSTRDFVEKI